MKKMKILVIGGTHGDEKLGISLVEYIQLNPIKNVEAVLANPKAIEAKKRFTESDLNRSFGNQYPGTYETVRAKQLARLCREFDLVLDFHNTETPQNNCSFVGVDCDRKLFEVAKILEFRRCIEATYDCINKYCLNTISIEISVGDKLDSVEYWYDKIQKMMDQDVIKAVKKLEIYRFKQRVTWEQKSKFLIKDWKPFKNISSRDKNNLGLSGIIVPIFIGSKLTEFYATLLSKEREE